MNGDVRTPIIDALTQKSDMEDLQITTSFFNIEDSLENRFQFLPKLTCLFLNLMVITDNILQNIFKNCLELRELSLISKKSVSFFFSKIEKIVLLNCYFFRITQILV